MLCGQSKDLKWLNIIFASVEDQIFEATFFDNYVSMSFHFYISFRLKYLPLQEQNSRISVKRHLSLITLVVLPYQSCFVLFSCSRFVFFLLFLLKSSINFLVYLEHFQHYSRLPSSYLQEVRFPNCQFFKFICCIFAQVEFPRFFL